MHCYLLAYMAGRAGADVLLGAKNVFGNRSCGTWQPKPIVWNNSGQIVIPGGGQGRNETPLAAAQREFAEETGVDFRVAAMRTAMECIGDPVVKVFKADPGGFCCGYQLVSNQSPLVGTINANIGSGIPADDELHDCALAAGEHAVGLFGPPQLTGWRLAQFNQLSPSEQRHARERMADPYDWFVRCVEHLVGSIYPEALKSDDVASG